MANQTITQLPAAGAITGTELVPIVQNGATVQTTTGAIAASPAQTQTFITVNNEPSLNNSRYLTTTGSGINTADGGPQSTLALSLTTPLQSLNTAGTGVMVKTGGGTILPRSIAAGTGLAVTDGDGVAANPTVSASGILLSLAASSGTAILARTSGGSIQGVTLQGTAGEIDVADGAGPSNPTIGLSDNPVIPGTGSITVPVGTTAQRPSPANDGMLRYNTDASSFEVYESGVWSNLTAGAVTLINTGTGLTGGPITTTGTISVATNGITDALLRQSSGLSVIGRSANSTGDVADIAAASDHQVLRRSGSTVDFGAVNLAQANAVTGTLPVASGGTGQATYSDGELLIGNSTGNTLTKATLTAGSNVTITNAAGAITIAASSSGGTVTSVGASFTGGIVSISGSPITTSGTLGFTVAGTSGGIPYFSSSSGWASSGVLAANALVVGGGAGVAPSTVTTGSNVLTALAVNVGTAGAFVVNGGALGTPSSGTLTSCTGLPVSTGVSGLGTNVATALAVNVGSAGAVVVNGGALGTPSSGTLTSCTGLPLTTGVTGTLGIGNGGTGVTATPTDGQLLIGNGAGFTLATITAGSNITITNASGAITIASTGGGGGGGAGSNIFLSNNFGGM